MIEELERLLKEATPGPWNLLPFEWEIHSENGSKVAGRLTKRTKDGALIIYLRNNVEKLLAVVKAARELEQKYKEMQSHIDSPPRRFEALFIALKALDTSSQAPKSEDPR